MCRSEQQSIMRGVLAAGTAQVLANIERRQCGDRAKEEAIALFRVAGCLTTWEWPRALRRRVCPECGGRSLTVDDGATVGHDRKPAVVLFCNECEWCEEV